MSSKRSNSTLTLDSFFSSSASNKKLKSAESQENQQKTENRELMAVAKSSSAAALPVSVSTPIPSNSSAVAANRRVSSSLIASSDEKTAVADFNSMEFLINPGWSKYLSSEYSKSYFIALKKFLQAEMNSKKKIFPPLNQVFRSMDYFPLESIRVVIIGQDPYHDDGQAEGLCFSVAPGVLPPPSLKNIFKELASEEALKPRFVTPMHGSLVKWAQQGVLLLNTSLTVRAHEANSHAKSGWQEFTSSIIRAISKHTSGVVWLLWGLPAQKKAEHVDASRHHLLKCAHPSPLSASRGFLGCKHFSKCNKLLTEMGKEPINWQI